MKFANSAEICRPYAAFSSIPILYVSKVTIYSAQYAVISATSIVPTLNPLPSYKDTRPTQTECELFK